MTGLQLNLRSHNVNDLDPNHVPRKAFESMQSPLKEEGAFDLAMLDS
jgi:hypothetical protein